MDHILGAGQVEREGLVALEGKTSSVMFDFSKRPWPLVFVAESVTDRGSFAQGSHCSGEFVFSFTGLMQVATIAEQYISPPPGHGIWLPPRVVHSAMNLYETCFCSVFIDEKWCSRMPSQVSILGVNPLLRAILDHLCRHSLTVPSSRAEESLFQVLYDQLCESPVGENYLTLSDDPELSTVLSTTKLRTDTTGPGLLTNPW